jgi:hypothetical protein
LHDVVFVVVGGGDDLFGDAEGGADFAAREFTIFQELKVGTGEAGLDNFGAVGKEERAIGGAGAALSIAEGGVDLSTLFFVELFVGANDEAVIGIIFYESAHEAGGGEVGLGRELGGVKRRETTPEIEGVGEFFEPDLFGQEDVGGKGGIWAWSVIAPADELIFLDDVLETGGVEDEDIFDF